MRRFGALAIALLAFASSAHAQTQGEMNARAGRDLANLNKRLNAVYAQLVARYSVEDKARLTLAERSWLKYRDDNCLFEAGGASGGSAYPLIQALCLQELTQERIKHLEYQANCEEGDLSCVEWKPNAH